MPAPRPRAPPVTSALRPVRSNLPMDFLQPRGDASGVAIWREEAAARRGRAEKTGIVSSLCDRPSSGAGRSEKAEF